MRNHPRFILIFIICVAVIGCSTVRVPLTLSDLDPKLEVLRDIGFDVVLVDYPTTGIEKYNDFFKSSAIIYSMTNITQGMVNDATANLKKYAQDHLASMVMDSNIAELIGDTPHDSLSVQQSAAIMRMEKENDNISDNEKKYIVLMAGNLGIGSLAMVRGVKEVPELLKKGTALLKDVRGDFTFFGIPKLWEIPRVTRGVRESVRRLKEVKDDVPVLAEDVKVLVDAFRALS